MRHGDFTNVAEGYAKYRPDYSALVLQALLRYVQADRVGFTAADVGAGTGIWTKMLSESGLVCHAVEPNDSMREQGRYYATDATVQWHAGSAESTTLETASVHWVTMASAFHWAKLPDALVEFRRILRPGGYLTVLWNPRNLQDNALHQSIEDLCYRHIPGIKRVSSGAAAHAPDYGKVIVESGYFQDAIFFEALHEIRMTKERYLGAWRTVNDIQSQATAEQFEAFLAAVAERIAPMDGIVVPYKTRAWTVRRVD